MTLLDIILEPPRMPRIVHRPDTADTILQVDSVKVQHMDLAPPPTAFESFLGGDVWTVLVVALALCACVCLHLHGSALSSLQ